MKKIFVIFLGFLALFNLTNCSKKEPFELEYSKYTITLVYQHVTYSSFINDMELKISDNNISFYSEHPIETFNHEISGLAFGKIPKKAWKSASLVSIGKYRDEDNADAILGQIKEIKKESKDKDIIRFISTHPDEDHIKGLKVVSREGTLIQSIGIDTWGVDYSFVDKRGALMANPYHYRDTRTDGMIEYADEVIGKKYIFDRTYNCIQRCNRSNDFINRRCRI